jgi:DNA (cytosine-5)-methyltransferase 1
MRDLVLSVFPGIDLLGRAFEEEGCCVVRGPDLVWGSDIRGFHPPAGVFVGVIGGPPCQAFSALRHLIRHTGHEPRFGNLIPEYERVIFEAQPEWFLMEEVLDAPIPHVEGYVTKDMIVRDKWVGGVQPRPRRFSFGTRDGRELDIEWAALMRPELLERSIAADSRDVAVKIGGSGKVKRTHGKGGVLSHGSRSILSSGPGSHGGGRGEGFPGGKLPGSGASMQIEDACEAMGLPRDFTKEMPFTMQGKRSVIGNGVPMAMGRAVAEAVRRATKKGADD